MKKAVILIIFVVGLTAGNVLCAGDPVNIEAIENLGMGGPGTAIQGKYDVLYNPALLGLKKGFHIRFFDLPISISNDIFKFYSFYQDNQEELENFSDQTIAKQTELLKEITDTVTKLRIRVRIGVLNPGVSSGPYPFYGRGGELTWGIGVFNQVDAGVKMNAGILIPTVDFWARGDVVFVVPLAYHTKYMPLRLPGEIYAGINLKNIMRYKYERNRMSVLEFESFDIETDDIKKGSGFGWDLGLLYDFSKKWNFSLVLKDLMSTRIGYDDDTSEVIKGQVDVGASYKINKLITLAADLRDIKFADFTKSTFFTKLHIGGEFNLLRIVRLRGGFYQGYPSFGFGLVGVLNYAFYGRELSMYPGLMPEWNHVVSLSFGF